MASINQRIRLCRQTAALTLEALAQKTGLTKGYLSRIENGATPPPFATVEKIAAALGVDLAEMIVSGTAGAGRAGADAPAAGLFAAATPHNATFRAGRMPELPELSPVRENGPRNPDVLEQGAAPAWIEPDAVYSFRPLVNSYAGKYMSPFEFCVKQGATERTSHDSEEFVYVRSGRVTLHYDGQSYPLQAGDSFYLDARLKHHFVNGHAETAYLISVHFNYRRF